MAAASAASGTAVLLLPQLLLLLLPCVVPIQVQDFMQGELLLDMRVTHDPNALFYGGGACVLE